MYFLLSSSKKTKSLQTKAARHVPWFHLLTVWCGFLFGWLLCQVPVPQSVSPDNLLTVVQVKGVDGPEMHNEAAGTGSGQPSLAPAAKPNGTHPLIQQREKLNQFSSHLSTQLDHAVTNLLCVIFGTVDKTPDLALKYHSQTWLPACAHVVYLQGVADAADNNITHSSAKLTTAKVKLASADKLAQTWSAVLYSLEEVLKLTTRRGSAFDWILWSQWDTYVIVKQLQLAVVNSLGKAMLGHISEPSGRLLLMAPGAQLPQLLRRQDCFNGQQKTLRAFQTCLDGSDAQPLAVRSVSHPCPQAQCNKWMNMILDPANETADTQAEAPTAGIAGLTGYEGAELRTIHYAVARLRP